MITALDTSILIALWASDDSLNLTAQRALDNASARGRLVISAIVFAESLAAPDRTEPFINRFVDDVGITIEWVLSESIWRAAGRAFQSYAKRRRQQGSKGPRRLIADFVIGAHAAERGYRLLTLDERIYRAAFPKLEIVRI